MISFCCIVLLFLFMLFLHFYIFAFTYLENISCKEHSHKLIKATQHIAISNQELFQIFLFTRVILMSLQYGLMTHKANQIFALFQVCSTVTIVKYRIFCIKCFVDTNIQYFSDLCYFFCSVSRYFYVIRKLKFYGFIFCFV